MSKNYQQQIDNSFYYYAPKDWQPETYATIRGAGKLMAETCVQHCPDSRELSLAMTKIEEAVMWANAAIARNS